MPNNSGNSDKRSSDLKSLYTEVKRNSMNLIECYIWIRASIPPQVASEY